MIYRTCYALLGFNKTECAKLGMDNDSTTAELEKKVEPTADIIAMYKGILESITGCILCIFVAPWSDRFGRKPVLVAGSIGGTCMMLIMVGFSFLENLSPWYMLLCIIPSVLTGGGTAFTTVLTAYLTDRTDEQHRGFRMGIFEGVMATAVLIGTASSAYILKATSYVFMYLLGTLCSLISLVYIIFFVPESLEFRETENKVKGFFEISSIKAMFNTAFKQREDYKRAIILMLIVVLSLFYVIIGGDGSVYFLFLREKFQWSLEKYNWFSSATNILWIVGTVLIVYIFHHLLKVEEAFLIFAGFLGNLFGAFITGFATKDWHIYLAALVRLPGAGLTPMAKSLMSKLVHDNEVAKIFSVFNIGSSLFSMAGAPIYTNLYNATINSNPAIFNFFTAGIHILNTIILGVILYIKRPMQSYVPLTNESQTEDPVEQPARNEVHSIQRQ
ncbi:probable peptidoglycan muropeptide transporter SLC46 isoform X2 [Cylas formicarius]|nr:probable peptidoglycan muropeptide transporter SLC46 isoform X2 [Cylas formicarius]XP_060530045.1 probable peptidoglycan muropeptide transporter SLC46 isoform X2 [Cylas formicarius]